MVLFVAVFLAGWNGPGGRGGIERTAGFPGAGFDFGVRLGGCGCGRRRRIVSPLAPTQLYLLRRAGEGSMRRGEMGWVGEGGSESMDRLYGITSLASEAGFSTRYHGEGRRMRAKRGGFAVGIPYVVPCCCSGCSVEGVLPEGFTVSGRGALLDGA